MEKQEQPTILNQNKAAKTAGFTLIEVLIALTIVVMMMSVGVPVINRITYQKVNSTSRKFMAIVKTIRNDAILLNNIYRLVIDVEHRAWWVETQRQFKLLSEPTEEDKKKKPKKGEPPPSNFVLADKYSKKPVDLPDGVAFNGVLKEKEGLIKTGVAYINFFPSGYVDQSILYLVKDGQHEGGYSIVIRSAAGRVEMENRYITTFEERN
jgi:prepilin-type N-terminal cleavage/methylation domain-containing protein